MKNSLFFLAFLIIFNPSSISSLSLFFKSNKSAYPSAQSPGIQENIALTAIIYTDETHWTLWINGEIIHPETLIRGGFSIEKVTAENVTLSLSPSKEGKRRTITLRPNNTSPLKDETGSYNE